MSHFHSKIIIRGEKIMQKRISFVLVTIISIIFNIISAPVSVEGTFLMTEHNKVTTIL